jgi:hypothetical protein
VAVLTRTQVRTLLIETLAAKRHRDPADLERELRAAGEECPCDSQWLVKAGVGAAKVLGIDFKPGPKDASALKSIDSLAEYIHARLSSAEAA